MKRLLNLLVRLLMIFAAVSLVWSCAAPPAKPSAEKAEVKQEVKKVKKKKAAAVKKQKKPKKKKVKKAAQPEAVEDEAGQAETVEEPLTEEKRPLVVGRMMFHYDYYPDVEVYFDTIRHLYFYRDKGRWTMSVALPTTFQKNLGRSVRLKISDDRPFTNHDEHLRHYPPALEKPGF